MFSLRAAAVAAAVALPIGIGAVPIRAHAAAINEVSVAFELRDLLDARGASRGVAGGYLGRFYATRQGAPAWWTRDGWSAAARDAVQQIARAEEDGLAPADYGSSKLHSVVLGQGAADEDAQRIAETELLLTRAVLAYLDDLANGRIDPSEIGWDVNRTRRIDPPSALQRGLVEGDFASWIAGVGPDSERYRRLRQARARYAEVAKVDWPFLPEGPTIRPGDRDPRVAVARRQLRMLEQLRTGDPSSPSVRRGVAPRTSGIRLVSYEPAQPKTSQSDSSSREAAFDLEVYDEELEAALRRFQKRQGILMDGLIGPETRAALNVSPKQRLEEIDLNLERLRWLSDSPGDRYVMVNIPSYELTAYANGSVVERMKVIVGQPDWKTPLFSDHIINLKFAPNWTIPASIVKEETLPKVRRDPGYLRRSNIRVFARGGGEVNPNAVNWHAVSSTSYVFRQEPGPANALGLVRFSLTNPMGIYLHDTPHDRLFEKSLRALSHGCIRVERPVDFAKYLLGQDPTWDRARIEDMMHSSETVIHDLEQSTPVHFVYLTAMVDEVGELHFRDDVYERNPPLREALERARSSRRNLS